MCQIIYVVGVQWNIFTEIDVIYTRPCKSIMNELLKKEEKYGRSARSQENINWIRASVVEKPKMSIGRCS